MTEQVARRVVLDCLMEWFGARDIAMSDTMDDLQLDSLDVVEVTMQLEEKLVGGSDINVNGDTTVDALVGQVAEYELA